MLTIIRHPCLLEHHRLLIGAMRLRRASVGSDWAFGLPPDRAIDPDPGDLRALVHVLAWHGDRLVGHARLGTRPCRPAEGQGECPVVEKFCIDAGAFSGADAPTERLRTHDRLLAAVLDQAASFGWGSVRTVATISQWQHMAARGVPATPDGLAGDGLLVLALRCESSLPRAEAIRQALAC